MNNLMIFDGVCNFCAKSVQFILRHESDHIIRFTTLQSSSGSRLMRELGIDPEDAETFVFFSDGEVFVKSAAAMKIVEHLGGGWRILRVFGVLPRPVLDWGYDILARNRYRWFGRYATCMVPSPEISDRFIDD